MDADDRKTLRSLAEKIARIAHSPHMENQLSLWKAKNGLRPVRPLVLIDEIPWHEMGQKDLAVPSVTDPFWQSIELSLRRTLYHWENIPSDLYIPPTIAIPRAIQSSGFGLETRERTAVYDAGNPIVGHAYEPQLRGEDDLARIVEPTLTEDLAQTARRRQEAHEIFSGLLDVRLQGMTFNFTLWDTLVEWMSPEQMLLDVAQRPEFLQKAIERMVKVHEAMALQAERKGFADDKVEKVHCTYTHNDFLQPAPEGKKVKLENCWCHGTAQIFGSISPKMHEVLEFQPIRRLYALFGAANYGCCEPLHDRMQAVRELPGVRKVSCSPWCDIPVAAQKMGKDYVMSRKPSPAQVGGLGMDLGEVRRDLKQSIEACQESGTPLEFLLKDISTVRYDPQRLHLWGKTAMELAMQA